jgi:hypothetical protein
LKTAWLNLRYSEGDRADAVVSAVCKLGFKPKTGLCPDPGESDLMVTWNRIGEADRIANRFRRVIVLENASWGKGVIEGRWLSVARDRHNTAGMFPVGGPERWDSLGVELCEWRSDGETVILPQRGIGSPPTAMPRGWEAKHKGRIRRHPGTRPAKPLKEDLSKCGRVVTWGSAAAIQALMMGIPVVSEMPNWIGEQDNTDEGRLAMFRRLAWAQWQYHELDEAFARLL